MKFNDNADLDTSQVDDQRGNSGSGGLGRSGGGFPGLGGGRSGGIPMGRGKMGIGGMIMMLIVYLIISKVGGGSSTTGGASQLASGDQTKIAEACKTGADANNRQDCRIVGVVNSVQTFWAAEFARNGQPYTKSKTTFFTDEVQTGCGGATGAVGPFYCPADKLVYIDLSFFAELQSKFDAQGGPFAEAYVIAHEYGHHVQDLLGQSAEVSRQGNQTGPKSGSVRLELQADCYAGVWANNATSGPNPLITEITDDDIRLGLDAAASVGDDRIQQKMQGQVDPHKWTHGSAASRQRWFLTGFKSGEPSVCDTFNTDEI